MRVLSLLLLVGVAHADRGIYPELSAAVEVELAATPVHGTELRVDRKHAVATLYAGLIFWTLGYDTVYAVQDLEDDALIGVKSSARRLGEAAPRGVLAFYAVSLLLAFGAGWMARLGPLFYVFTALFGAHLARQAVRLKVDDPMRALALFKSNTLAGLLMFAALVAGGVAGLNLQV